MKVVTNDKLIASRAKLGKRASLIGLLILVAGFAISFSPNLFYISLGCLIIGFTVSNIGVYNANQWIKEPRADQVLSRGLKGFSNKFTLFNYTGPIPHGIVGPPGIVVFLVKLQEGKITVDGNRWKQAFSFQRLMAFFGSESLGNPGRDLKALIRTATEASSKALPGVEVPVHGAVVFSSPKAELTIRDSEVPVLTEKDLKDFLKGLTKQEILNADQRKTLMEEFQGSYEAADKSAEV